MDEQWERLHMYSPAPLPRALISRELLAALSYETLVAIAWDVQSAVKTPGVPPIFSNTMSATRIVDVLVRMRASDVTGQKPGPRGGG